MYISKVSITNFRRIKKQVINLNAGFNLMVGPNDSGKTTIIDAIRLGLSTRTDERLSVLDGDFNVEGQEIEIDIEIQFTSDDESSWFAEWLTWNEDGTCKLDLYCRTKKLGTNDYYYLRKTAGPSMDKSSDLDVEVLDRIKAIYLKAVRDSNLDLIASNASRLAKILAAHTKVRNNKKEILENYEAAAKEINKLFEDQGILYPDTTKIINSYFDNFNEVISPAAKIGFPRTVNNSDRHLKTVLQRFELWSDEHLSGLGTANALYMAAELMLLEDVATECLKFALIEELEAHIHPTRQLKIVKALQKECEDKGIQILATSHSPNLASVVKIENLILCHDGTVFSYGSDSTELALEDFRYLQRFLDVTKSNIFFSRGLIFVEGITEQLMVPTIARLIGLDLTEYGVSVVNVSNLGFSRFTKAFKRKAEPFNHLPLAIITDADKNTSATIEARLVKNDDVQNNIKWFYGKRIDEEPIKSAKFSSAIESATFEKIILSSNSDLKKIYSHFKIGKALKDEVDLAYGQIEKKKAILAQETSLFIDRIISGEKLEDTEESLNGITVETLSTEIRTIFPNIVEAIQYSCRIVASTLEVDSEEEE